MPQQINQDYVKDYYGKIIKKSECDPDMLHKMASVGALYSATNEEVTEWEAKRIGEKARTSI